jgi:hypothetical protein
MSIVLCVRPIVGMTQRLTMTKRRESIMDVDVMRSDSCTVTSGCWYRTHAERNRVIKDGLVWCKSVKLAI